MGFQEVIVPLREAYALDLAAGQVQRLANLPASDQQTPQQHMQRKAILEIAYKLIYAERDKHLTLLVKELS